MCPRGLSIYSNVHGRQIRIEVLSDALLLEWVPTGVTWVSNNNDLISSCISYVYASQIVGLGTKQ